MEEETGKAYKEVYGRGERKRGRPTRRFMGVVRGNGEGLQGGLWAW